MVLLTPTEYDLARPVLNALDHHLAAACVLEGIVPARLYINHPDHPTTALAVASRRYFLAGNSENEAFNGSLQRLFAETIYPQAQAAGETMFVLYYQPASWTEKLEQILKDKHPVFTQRQYYRFKELKTDWRSLLPEGFTLRQADREILADPQIKNPDFLTEEMCSERESVDDFLQKSFGLCLVHEHEIVGWCLSEYNHADGCEIGIAVSPPYQRRGFATLLASAFIETAHSQGITHIGWHCYASNLPSVATALKIGFEKVADYPICLGWFNETDALAVQGDVCFDRQQYAESLDWLERAFACGQVQGWAYWVAACSAAMLGDNKKAFKYLGQAVEKGFADSERLQNSPFLVSLHDYPEWQVLFRFYDHPKKSL
jgi:RimJ/RimL family protein N-acetyltransferase